MSNNTKRTESVIGKGMRTVTMHKELRVYSGLFFNTLF